MSGSARSVLLLSVSILINVHAARDSFSRSGDDDLGEDYVALEDVREARRQMESRGYGYGLDWILMPDGNGNPRVALLTGSNSSRLAANDEKTFGARPARETVHLTLFTQSNPDTGVEVTPESVRGRSTNFDPSKPTKVIIHGWQSSADSDTVRSIRDAYLNRSDVNVISVDWSEPAGSIFYPASAAYTKTVGRYVAGVIDDLVASAGAKYDDFHIVGHSLGAHTAGVVGHSVHGSVSRITGLDPALPCFQDVAEPEDKLDKTDAEFVEVIHTCAGALGMSTPVGHADFYPNGGSPFQPGCCCMNEFIHACSHGRSHKYFAESILFETAFEAVKCPTWTSFKANACDDMVTPMGEHTPATTRGIFYLRTGSTSPFGLGLEGLTYT